MLRRRIKNFVKRAVKRALGRSVEPASTGPCDASIQPQVAAPEVPAPESAPPTARAVAPDPTPESRPAPGIATAALQKLVEQTLRPALRSGDADLQLLGVEGTQVQLELSGSLAASASSRAGAQVAIEELIRAELPDVEAVRFRVAS